MAVCELCVFRVGRVYILIASCFVKAHANGPNKCQQLPTLLGVVSQQCCVRLHGPKSLTGFKLYATRANIVVVPCKRTQQVTTLLGPTMLAVVSQQCWVRLHGPLGAKCTCRQYFNCIKLCTSFLLCVSKTLFIVNIVLRWSKMCFLIYFLLQAACFSQYVG